MHLKKKRITGFSTLFLLILFLMLLGMEVYGQEMQPQIKAVNTKNQALEDREGYDICSERDFWQMHNQKNPYGISMYVLGETIDETGLLRSNLEGPALEIYDWIDQADLSYEYNGVDVSLHLSKKQSAEGVYSLYKSVFPQAMWSYEYDHLEEFYWNDLNGVSISSQLEWDEDGEVLVLTFEYLKSDYYTPEIGHRAEEKLNQGISGAKKYSEKLAQLKFLNKWVCDNCTYDYAALYAANYTRASYFAHSMTGLLVNGKGVCESYAKTMKLLCQDLNIPCVFVVSSSHAFDYVKIDGNWYMIDCTFNDSDDNPDEYMNYFLISNEPPIDRVHVESDAFVYPQTASRPYVKKSQTLMVTDESDAEISSLKMNVGKTVCLSVYGSFSPLKYISKDTSIATVTQTGKVTALKPGIVKIQIMAEEDAEYEAASKTITVTVRPTATKKVTLANLSKGIKVTWEKVPYAKGYYIYRGSKQIAKIDSGKTTVYKDSVSLTNGSKYTYKVFAYADTGKSTAYKSAYTYHLSRLSIISLKNSSSKKMIIKYGKNSKASGYEIQYSKSSDFSSRKTINVSSNQTVSKTISNLTKGKTYYVRVRNYKKVNGIKYYSAWSVKKSINIKK